MLTSRRSLVDARHGAPDDAGISLVEVMVAMVISTIVGAMVLLYLLSAVGSARRADGQNEQAAGARVVLDSWSAIVPYAVDPNGVSSTDSVRFYSLAPTSVRFCVGMNSKSSIPMAPDLAPIGMEIALVAGQLIEKRYKTCALMVSGGTHVRRILAPYASLISANAWLMTPLAAAEMNLGGTISTGLLTSSLTTGLLPLSALVPADVLKIKQITGLQLAFKTLPAPGRPSAATTYTTLLALTTGG